VPGLARRKRAAVARSVATSTVAGFLDALGAATPTPAGGATCAVAAAMSAALAAMVARAMARRSGVAELETMAASLDDVRQAALALADEDSDAYRAVMDARRARDRQGGQALRDALRRATDVPLAVARASHAVLIGCDRLAREAAALVKSDVAVAGALAHAALEGALRTARANVWELDGDPEFTQPIEEELQDLASDASLLRHRILDHTGRRR
jgi:formiminotetrahydrofolate cyclodeaminase